VRQAKHLCRCKRRTSTCLCGPKDFRIEGCRVLAGMRSTCTLIEDDGLWFQGSEGSQAFCCGAVGKGVDREGAWAVDLKSLLEQIPTFKRCSTAPRLTLPRPHILRRQVDKEGGKDIGEAGRIGLPRRETVLWVDLEEHGLIRPRSTSHRRSP